MADQITPREEFEAVFGPIHDYQWQWLKEFVVRHYQPDRTQGVIGYRIPGDDKFYHPSDVEILLDS